MDNYRHTCRTLLLRVADRGDTMFGVLSEEQYRAVEECCSPASRGTLTRQYGLAVNDVRERKEPTT